MSTICKLCGDTITFRHLSGGSSRTPIHQSGRCGGALYLNTFAGSRCDYDSICFLTPCPECDQEVFFIRHNGGSCWIDPPLGAPWYKHACFHVPQSGSGRISLLQSYQLNGIGNECTIGVINFTQVSWTKKSTKVIMSMGMVKSLYLLVPGSAGFLLGKLCIYDRARNVVYPIDTPHLRFSVRADVRNEEPLSDVDSIVCPECEETVALKDLELHLEKEFYISNLIGS